MSDRPLDDLLEAGDALIAEQRDDEFRRRPWQTLSRKMDYADSMLANYSALGWMPPRPRRVATASPVAQASLSKFSGIKRLFSARSLLIGARALSVGLIVGMVATLLVRLPTGTIADARREFGLSLWVAAALLLVATGASAITWRYVRQIPSARRTSTLGMWSPLAAVSSFLCSWTVIGAWFSTSNWAPSTPTTMIAPVDWAVGAASAIAAVCIHAAFTALLDHRAHLRSLTSSRSRANWLPPAVTASVALLACLLSLVAPLPFATPSLAASLTTIDQGMQGDEPTFFNPDDMAVASDGTLAVLERYSDKADVIWMKRPEQPWSPQVRIPRERLTPSDDSNAWSLNSLSSLPASKFTPDAAIPIGDPITSISSFDFLSPTRLAVIGVEGVSTIDLSDSAPVARLRDMGVREDAYDRNAQLIVDGEDVVVSSFDGDTFQSAHSSTFASWSQLKPCADAYQGKDDPLGYVVRISDVLGEATAAPQAWADGGVSCRRYVYNLIDSPEGPAVIEYALPDSQPAFVYRPLDDRPATKLANYDETLLRLGPAVEANGRIFVDMASCLSGFALSSATVELPQLADRSWYDDDPANDLCHAPAYGAGYIGAEVSAPAASAPEIGGETSGGSPDNDLNSCEPPRAGVTVLDVYQWSENATTVDDEGTIYVAADAGYRCTMTVWKLGPSETVWIPVDGIATSSIDQRDRSATMFAVSPTVGATGASWLAPAMWRIVNADGSEQFIRSGPTNSYRAMSGFQVTVPFGTISALVGTDDLLELDPERTKLVVNRANAKLPTYEVSLPHIRDLVRPQAAKDEDARVVVALCDAIVMFDASSYEAGSADGWFVPPADAFTVLVGSPDRVPFAPEPTAADCGEVKVPARDAHSDVDIPLRPTAMDAVLAGDDILVAYAETATFDGTSVTRVRVADPNGVLPAPASGDIVYTLGCDDDTAYDGTCTGDLSDLDLEVSDIALREDGTLAVSTTTENGWGPVLLFRDGERSVVRLDPAVLASGVAWEGEKLIVTDAARGNILELTFPD
ncbi:hypothetical protein PlfCFBP13513_08610 [Plantibacter flavus]|nr:hypothetical protein PlfCFBP13513_08610 [Plantibacter flavus]